MWNYRRMVLCGVALLGFSLNVALFFPGYMSTDSVVQLSQMLGRDELTDMQPLAMVAVWRALFYITGHTSALLIMQLAMLWLALTLLAIYIYQETRSFAMSMSPFIIAILPFVLNISGVLWKDNQMAFALLLAVVSCLYFQYVSSRRYRILILGGVLCLMVYACLVRYNAIPAIVPLFFLAIKQSGVVRKVRWQVILTASMCVLTVLLFSSMSVIMQARQSHPGVFVMIDDVVNVASDSDIRNMQGRDSLKHILMEMKTCSSEKKSLINNYWVCASDDQRALFRGDYSQDMKNHWVQVVTHHPGQYILYKIESYASFLFPAEGASYVWQDGIEPNNLEQNVKYERLGSALATYVNNFGYKHFSFLFEPWFWLFLSIIFLTRLIKRGKILSFSGLTILSALLYLLSYLATGATVDYRFIYWSVIASMVSMLVIFVDNKYCILINNDKIPKTGGHKD